MKKIVSLIIIFSCISGNIFAATQMAYQPTRNSHQSKTQAPDCSSDDNDMDGLKKNPGLFYFRMALCRFDSINGESDFNKVISLLNESAKHNFPASYFAAAIFYQDKYEHGGLCYGVKGKPTDIIQAIKYYKLAASFGITSAENNLGEIYLNEANIKTKNKSQNDVESTDDIIQLPDVNQAIYWLDRAAKHGQPAAQGTLADLYKQGIGVTQDYVMAYIWTTLSVTSQYKFNAKISNTPFGNLMTTEQDERDKLRAQLTEKQKDRADEILVEYAKKYIEQPDALESYCRNIQTVISGNNARKLLSVIIQAMPKEHT